MLLPVRQKFPHRAIRDIPVSLQKELEASGLASTMSKSSRVAIGVGSRGISNLATLARGVVDYFARAGHRPFLFPAMGSHGAGTAEGQASVLAHFEIDEAHMGCPVLSTFDVMPLGRTELGIETFAGREAWESDGVFLINRVKWHTSFAGSIESGVSKMMAIGLGKREGATFVHGHGRKLGMTTVIRSVAAHILATGKIVGGLAVLEDAFHETAGLAVLPPKGLLEREEELLGTVKSWMAKIPSAAIDVLIVDEIGKNISGTGMDLKIVNRGTSAQCNLWRDTTKIERIFVRDLSPMSYGNAVGVGAADVIHDRILPKIDVNAGRVNAVTSGSLALVRTPLHFGTDRECFDVVASTVGCFDAKDLTVAWIKNTLDLEHLAISENLRDEIEANPTLEIVGPAFRLPFDRENQLPDSYR